MTIAGIGPQRIHGYQTEELLSLGASIIDESGVVDALLDYGDERSLRRTVRAVALRGLLIAIFVVCYAVGPAKVADVFRFISHQLTADQRRRLGFPLNDDDIDIMTHSAEGADAADAQRKTKAVYQRIWSQLNRYLEPIDTTPTSGARKRRNRAEHAKTAPSDRKDRLDRQHDIVNRIIRASLTYSLPDGSAALDAIPHWKGDVTIDGHHVTLGLLNGNADEALTAVPRAKAMAHVRRLGGAMAIDITAVVAVGRPTEPHVPGYVLAATIGDPKGADTPGALAALDLADANGFRPRGGTRYQMAIVDQGFSDGVGFNEGLLDRNYTLVAESAIDDAILHNLDRSGALHGGPYLFNGQIFCPGALPLLRSDFLDCPPSRADADAWVQYREREAALFRGRMPTNGRPVRTVKRATGRPRKDAPQHSDSHFRVAVQCPARAGYAVCALLEGRGIQWPDGMGRIPGPPVVAVESDLPKCCTQMTTNVLMDEAQFKQYQGFVRGSEEHRDWYEMARAQNERAFSRLTDSTGANLRDRSVTQRKDGILVILFAMAMAIVNVKERQRYESECAYQNSDALTHERREAIRARPPRRR